MACQLHHPHEGVVYGEEVKVVPWCPNTHHHQQKEISWGSSNTHFLHHPSPQPSYLSFLNIWGLSIIFLYCHILLLMCLNCNYELILFSVKGLFRILMLERQWYYLRSFLYTLIKKNLYIIFYRKLVTLLFDLRKILVTPFTK